MAGGDDKLLGFLGRYQSEKAFVEAAKKDRDAARSRTVSKLPDNPTDDEIAAYRKDNGIPDAPEGYLEALPEGLVVGDVDKPFVNEFLTKMHGVNAPPSVTAAALESYYDIIEDRQAELADAANEAKNTSIEALREEWGGDYKRNLNIANSYLDTLPPEVANIFKHGTVPVFDDKGNATGKVVPIGYTTAALKFLTAQALEANPVATVVPGAGSNQASAIADEIATLESKMGNRQSDYWKGPTSAKQQARYLELVTAREKLANR